jgi:hypothetical protein
VILFKIGETIRGSKGILRNSKNNLDNSTAEPQQPPAQVAASFEDNHTKSELEV